MQAGLSEKDERLKCTQDRHKKKVVRENGANPTVSKNDFKNITKKTLRTTISTALISFKTRVFIAKNNLRKVKDTAKKPSIPSST